MTQCDELVNGIACHFQPLIVQEGAYPPRYWLLLAPFESGGHEADSRTFPGDVSVALTWIQNSGKGGRVMSAFSDDQGRV